MTSKKNVAIGLLAVIFGISFSWPTAAAVKLVPRRMDNVPVQKSVANTWPIAVMIDNHPAARPQAGLDKASIVYEALAEGGIPRFMAIFVDTNVKRIGPIRSTRPYFVKYASEYGAAMAHAGGSPDGLKMVKDLRLLSLWAIKGKYAKFFFRIERGVHTLFTNTTKLKAALTLAKYNRLKPTYRPYTFKIDAPVAQRAKGKHGVTIDLGAGRSYTIRYDYDRRRNVYLRSTGGRPHRDRTTKKQLAVKNVIIINVPKEKVLDRKGRLDIQTVGKGRGFLLQNGYTIPITWNKPSTRSRTIFKNLYGREVRLITGNTWMTVVPKGRKYNLF